MVEDHKEKRAKAEKIIRRYALGSTLTAFGSAALTSALWGGLGGLMLVEELSDLYDVPYSEQMASGILAAATTGAQAGIVSAQALRVIPILGLLGGGLPAAALNAGLTYLVGQALAKHYEAGGQLQDFNLRSAL